MFAEEEWTDGLPAGEQPHAGVRAKIFGGKAKAVSKHCLNRTLQTLGSVPTWDSVGASDGSDGEMDDAPVHVKKRKKKCKKRKKISDGETEGEQPGEADVPETPVKKRRSKKKKQLKEPSPHTTSESVRDGEAKDHTEDTAENKLSRKQWKNKMKNKKRCKNKFLQNAGGAAKVHSNKDISGEKQTLTKEEKTRADAPPAGAVKSAQKTDFVLSESPHAPENDKILKKQKKKKGSEASHSHPVALEPVCEQPKEASPAVQKPANPHEQREKQKQLKADKTFQHQAKRLRHILQGSLTDRAPQKSSTEEKPETADLNNEERKSSTDRSSALRSRMEKRLESARFRYINELLYSSTSGEAKRMFKQDPDAIGIYHKGYVEQVKHWPANPVDSIISYIRQRPASLVVADFGCGDCKIARSVKNKVHCFDLAPVSDLVTACDMANVPLADSTVDIAVFCLSLMGTNLSDFLAEANRVLVDGGVLKIAEVASRFDDIRQFTGALSRLGFKLVSKDTDNTHFYCFEFIKIRNAPDNVKKIWLQLNPCLYKKR
ncbi:uncharacterized protein rrp8 [Salminus brasiliensis]|uniref:uncharacterized protein rrp8 n=1 Tax=Salminus brasiliensis TaxID=930266 RepID=UPI003B830E62